MNTCGSLSQRRRLVDGIFQKTNDSWFYSRLRLGLEKSCLHSASEGQRRATADEDNGAETQQPPTVHVGVATNLSAIAHKHAAPGFSKPRTRCALHCIRQQVAELDVSAVHQSGMTKGKYNGTSHSGLRHIFLHSHTVVFSPKGINTENFISFSGRRLFQMLECQVCARSPNLCSFLPLLDSTALQSRCCLVNKSKKQKP